MDGNILRFSEFDSFDSDEKKTFQHQEKLNWFNQKDFKQVSPNTNKAKTKLITSIKKDYTMSFLQDLVDSGIRIFRINGAYFHSKEYEKLLNDLNLIFSNTDDRPTLIFDLKGPIPRITKIATGKTSIEVKKDSLLKILHENPKITEPDIIHVDKKIAECINVGDQIVIDSSKCVLKVISIERYKAKNSISKRPGFKSTHRLAQKDYDETELAELSENEMVFQDQEKVFILPLIEEVGEEGSIFKIEDNLDFSIEERLIHRQTNMNIAYQNIIRKHKHFNHFNRINEIDRLNSFSQDLIDLSCKKKLIIVKSTEDDNRIYIEKRERIRSSRGSSSNHVKSNNMILCEVNHSGTIYLNKKVFLLDKEILSELGNNPIGVKDIVDINKTISCGINIITALVNSAENVEEIKSLAGQDTIFFARIETSEAIYNFDSILEISDGIIIQQGLLSSKIPYEDLCLIEMYIIEKCKIKQKPIFMQTCILKSMMHRVKPSITEISNIDHAVNVGVDGLILKEEITMAHNHTEIIRILREILLGIEALSDSRNKYEELSKFYKIHKEFSFDLVIESILDCAVKTVFDLGIGLIILYTDKYQFAKTLSKYRPNCRIVCVTQSEKTFDYLRLIRGVSPFLISTDIKSLDSFTDKYVYVLY